MNDKEWLLKKKGNRPNRAYIWNETYEQGCYILWPVDSDQLKAEYINVNRDHEFTEDEDFEISVGKFISCADVTCLAFSSSRPTAGVIAHEAMHLVNHFYDKLGIRPSLNNDEPQAYLLMWAVDKIYNLTRGKK